jgi:hypothetical protein
MASDRSDHEDFGGGAGLGRWWLQSQQKIETALKLVPLFRS